MFNETWTLHFWCSLLYHSAMPRVFDWNGCLFFFYSSEGDSLESLDEHFDR